MSASGQGVALSVLSVLQGRLIVYQCCMGLFPGRPASPLVGIRVSRPSVLLFCQHGIARKLLTLWHPLLQQSDG